MVLGTTPLPSFFLKANLAFECNIYRVDIYRSSCPFVGHEIEEPRCTKYTRTKARARSQPRTTRVESRCQPRPYGAARECEVRCFLRSSRADRLSFASRSRSVVRKAIELFDFNTDCSRLCWFAGCSCMVTPKPPSPFLHYRRKRAPSYTISTIEHLDPSIVRHVLGMPRFGAH